MKLKLVAVLFSASLATLSTPTPADACGVKLTIKGSAHRKGVAKTSNPSDVLIVGNPPRRLSRDLASAGHRVEVAESVGTAKRKSYAVVVADNEQAPEARSKFSGAVIIVRSGDVVADMKSVENRVARKPVSGSQDRAVVAARDTQRPIAVGPPQERREIVGATEQKEPEAPKPVVAPPPPPRPAVAGVTTARQPDPKPEAKPPEAKPDPKPEVASKPRSEPKEVASKPAEPSHPAPNVPSKAWKSGQEVYFGLGVASSNAATLAAVTKWMNANPDVQIVVEGHADPIGNPESNLKLSEKRAEWVRDTLVAAGIDSSRIEVASFGDTKLKYDADDRRNRRVMIVAK